MEMKIDDFKVMIGEVLDEKLKGALGPVEEKHQRLPLASIPDAEAEKMSVKEQAKQLFAETFSVTGGAWHSEPMKDYAYRSKCADFFKAISLPANSRTQAQHELLLHSKTAQTALTNGTGGYTVPPGFVAEILYKAAAYTPIWNLVNRIPMGVKMQIPIGANGFTVYWPGEGTAITESNATFTQGTLTAHPQGVLARLNRMLIEGSGVDILGWVRDRCAEVIAVDSEDAITNGSGSNKPTGFTAAGYTGIAAVSMASSAVAFADFISTQKALDPKYWAGASWVMNTTGWSLARKLQSTTGDPLFREPWGNLSMPDGAQPFAGPVGSILGRPVYIVNKISATYGSSGSYTTRIYFGQFKDLYAMGEMNSMRVETSTEAGSDTFAADQMLLKLIRYWDGAVMDQSAAVYLDGVK